MQEARAILDRYVDSIKEIYGTHLTKVILYGSYARGDYNANSDIDIMILLDISDLEAKEYQKQLFDATYDYSVDNDIEINPLVHSEELFLKWIDAYPFFNNIKNDGVVLYGAA